MQPFRDIGNTVAANGASRHHEPRKPLYDGATAAAPPASPVAAAASTHADEEDVQRQMQELVGKLQHMQRMKQLGQLQQRYQVLQEQHAQARATRPPTPNSVMKNLRNEVGRLNSALADLTGENDSLRSDLRFEVTLTERLEMENRTLLMENALLRNENAAMQCKMLEQQQILTEMMSLASAPR